MAELYARRDYGNALVVFTDGNVINQVFGFNDSGADGYVQVHDGDLIVAGATAELSWLVPAGASFSWIDALAGLRFSTGLWWGFSSTADTYTATAGDLWVGLRGRFD